MISGLDSASLSPRLRDNNREFVAELSEPGGTKLTRTFCLHPAHEFETRPECSAYKLHR